MNRTLQQIVAEMSPEIYQRIAAASETGKWPDGVALSEQQREHCLQLVMLWQATHNHQPQHMTLAKGGEMVMKSKRELKQEFGIDEQVIRLDLQ